MIRAVIFSLILLTGCTSIEGQKSQEITPEYLSQKFDSEFFANSEDPFQEIHLASQEPTDPKVKDVYRTWYWDNFGRFPAERIHYAEDEKTRTITLDVKEIDRPELKLRIKDGFLHLDGSIVTKMARATSTLRVVQKLPIADDVDPLSVVSYKSGDSFIIRLEKI